jgi:hypothetical protein
LKEAVKPKVIAPFASLKDLLAELLARPGMEEKIDAWRGQPLHSGRYQAIWDGKIWKTICDAEGDLFSGTRTDTELRIAGTCSLDWYAWLVLASVNCLIPFNLRFQARRGDFSPSHSSGVISFAVANLPAEIK